MNLWIEGIKMDDILNKIDQKEDLSKDITQEVLNNPQMLPEILKMLSSTTARVKFRSAKILKMISAKNPKLLYPNIDLFIELLDSGNKIIIWNAMDIIANLSSVDTEGKINEILEKYYHFLDDESMITAAHVVDNSWKIVKAKPEYEKKVTDKLLEIEKTPRDKECQNILLGKAILSFDKYFHEIGDKEAVNELIKRQLDNSRNATKIKAERFLNKHSNCKN